MRLTLRILLLTCTFFTFIPAAEAQEPVAGFFANDGERTGCPSLTVQFHDQSVADAADPIVGWEWDFGDGTTSTDFEPTHTYDYEGLFTVRYIVVTQSGLRDTMERVDYVSVAIPFNVDLGPDTVMCSGANIILNAEVPGATGYLWSDWSSDSQIQVFFENEYYVEVTKDGCVDRDTIYVTQKPLLTADFDYIYIPGECAPTDVEFLDLTQSCNSTIIEWHWEFGDGETSALQNPKHKYAAPGEYTVYLTVTDDAGSFTSAVKTITIDALPSPVVELGDDLVLCEGATAILSAANAGADYSWSTGEVSQSISVNTAGRYFVTVTRDGCSTTDSIDVTLNPALAVGFSFAQQNNCTPVTFQFTDTSVFCSGSINTWQWDFGDGASSSGQHPQHDYAAAGTYTVKLTVTHSDGLTESFETEVTATTTAITLNLGADTAICSSELLTLDAANPGFVYEWSDGATTQTITRGPGEYSVRVSKDGCTASDTILIRAITPIHAAFTPSILGNCLPVPVNFSDASTVTCGQQVATWHWEFGDGNSSNEQHPSHQYLSADSFDVTLTVTTDLGISSVYTAKVGVTNTIHSVSLPNEMKVCTGTTALLDAGVAGATYQWQPSANLDNPFARQPQVTPTANEWYRVDVTRCMVTVSDSVYVKLDSANRPLITQQENILKSSDGFAYKWYYDSALISGANAKTIRLDRRGYYSVKVMNGIGCERESERFFFMPVSGKEKEGIRVKCSPNPTRGMITIALSEIPVVPAEFTIRNVHGSPLIRGKIKDHLNTIDAGSLSKGMYVVEILFQESRVSVPVLIQ